MSATATKAPAINQLWPEQGGIYIGDRLIDGKVHHIIIPGGTEFDIEACHNNAAERIAAKGEINGFSDWRNGSQEDYMLAYINARDKFNQGGVESIYVSSTPYGSCFAWAVGFEYGSVGCWGRSSGFLVRPFRSIIASSI